MRDATEPAAELMVGQPGLIPWFAEMPTLTYSTCNARSEEISQKLTYQDPWRYGKRGIIPAFSFEGPCCETGRNVWWRLWRADGKPWGLAGLWNTLIDEASGDIHESHIMLTINADAHPLLAGMHVPDSNLGPNRRGNRSVITVSREGVYPWLYWTIEGALHLLRFKPAEHFDAVARR